MTVCCNRNVAVYTLRLIDSGGRKTLSERLGTALYARWLYAVIVRVETIVVVVVVVLAAVLVVHRCAFAATIMMLDGDVDDGGGGRCLDIVMVADSLNDPCRRAYSQSQLRAHV
uniref:Uncharacterized protein n=1 Tax=Caenorhabditis japonica TaxID=281687 RepID=A0A8R1EBY5_CAEJA